MYMLDTVPSPARHSAMSVAAPVWLLTTESPANRPPVTAPVTVEVYTPPTISVRKFSVSSLVCPVFHVMVDVLVPEPASVRQLRFGTVTLTLVYPDVTAGTVVETHGPNTFVDRTVAVCGEVVSGGVNVMAELVGGAHTRSPTAARAGVGTTERVRTAENTTIMVAIDRGMTESSQRDSKGKPEDPRCPETNVPITRSIRR
ncbi:MAG: hypothetical protein WBA97_28085 [Actinophytocola sp.]